MEESSCLPPLSNAYTFCAETFESPLGLARRRHLLHPLTCRPNHRRFETPIALLSCLVLVMFTGCGANYTVTAAGIGTFQASTDSVDFGTVTVGQIANSSLTLVNQSSSAIQVSDVKVTGNGFSLADSSSLTFSIAANSTFSLALQFQPKANGDSTGQLTVTSTSSTSPSLKIKLHGKGATAGSTSPALSSISCSQSAFTGTGSDLCTVTLTTAAAAGSVTVSLLSNNSAVTVPGSVTVPAGAISVGFSASVLAVSSTQTATLTASEGGVSATFALQLTASQPALSSLSCSNFSMTGSGSDTCTATLTAAAPNAGSTVTLSSNNTAVVVPASVIVPAGTTSIGFSASITAVSTTQTATLTASAGGATTTYTLQLNAAVPTLTINTGSISFGDITLNTTATQSINLTSSGTTAVNVSSANVTGTGFTLSGITFPITLNPGQTAALNVAFLPTTTGTVSGQVTISSTSSTNPTATVTLSGTGVAASYQVNLAWIAPVTSPDPVAGYNVYRAPSGTGSYQLLNSTPNASITYSDTKVQNGLSYDYVVKSVDSSGVESTASNTATVSIP